MKEGEKQFETVGMKKLKKIDLLVILKYVGGARTHIHQLSIVCFGVLLHLCLFTEVANTGN